MERFHLFFLAILFSSFITGCDSAKLADAQVDLEQLADQIIITYPANYSVITEPRVVVRADIPTSANAQEVTLLVDGIEVAKDTDGAPWEIEWPAYYWSDNNVHSLFLKTVTGAGNEVRNYGQFQVAVASEANKALSFKAGLAGAELQDTDTIDAELTIFEGATGYELQYTSNSGTASVDTFNSNNELSGLDVGKYELKYRAYKSYSNSTVITGSWSDPINVSILPPLLPILNDPVVSETLDGYSVAFSWEDLGLVDDSFTIFIENLSNSTVQSYETIDNSIVAPSLSPGQYNWWIERVNQFAQVSTSSKVTVDVGTFTKRFGGSGNDYARKFLATSDGGYIILARTNSYEILNGTLSQTQNWVIKTDQNGELIWQKVLFSESSSASLMDIIELSDGAFAAVGYDYGLKDSIAIKLDSAGGEVWSVVYHPEAITDRYDFGQLIEFNNQLYVSGNEWGAGSCTSCTKIVATYLHSISLDSGVVSDPINLPSLAGVIIDSIREMKVTSDGRLLVAGYAYPEGHIDSNFEEGGGYFQFLDENLNQIYTWNNVGDYQQINFGDAIELPGGDFVFIGQSFNGDPALSRVNISTNTSINSSYGYYNQLFYGMGNIVSDVDNNIYGLFQDQGVNSYPYPLALVSFNQYLVSTSISYLSGYNDYVSPVGLARNQNGTFTLLFNEGENNSYNNYDIVLVKRGSE